MFEHWLEQLQDEVGEWSEDNFGSPDEQEADLPLIGAGEELGELSTSVLKQAQGIDDSDKYTDRVGPEAEKDAIADVTIYLLDMVHRSPAPLDIVEPYQYWTEETDDPLFSHVEEPVHMIRQLYMFYGDLQSAAVTKHVAGDPRDPLADDVAELLVGLQQFCRLRGYDYKQCVIETWGHVSHREWDAGVSE